jgi:3-oxoacyl-[acyl-carrier protein] reductase
MDATRADWQRVFDVNVAGMFQCCQLAAGLMMNRQRGKIVNIASIYGLVGTDERLYGMTPGASPGQHNARQGQASA